MKPKTNHLLLYAITDTDAIGERNFEQAIKDALKGGISILQLREKGCSHDELVNRAIQIKKLCEPYHVPLIINDDYLAAVESGADGVHVGQEDTSVREIRAHCGPDFIIGATAKTVQQAQKAQDDGANYLGVGAIFPSPTKKDAIRITSEQLRDIANCVHIPTVAIGGITKDNLTQLTGLGIDGVALVSAIFAQQDITAACRTLKEMVQRTLGKEISL